MRKLSGNPRLVMVIGAIVFGIAILVSTDWLIAFLLLGLLSGGTMVMLALLTRQQMTQSALRHSEPGFRVLNALDSDWYWETDAQYRFTRVSEGLKRLSGRPESEYLGKICWEIPFCAPTGSEWSVHQAAIAQQAPFRDLWLRFLSSGGAVGYASFSGKPVFGADGALAGYRGVSNDITVEVTLRQRLRMQHDVTRILSRAADTAAALREVIEVICRTMEWQWGAHRHRDQETQALICQEYWLAPGISAEAFVALAQQPKPVSAMAGPISLALLENKIVWLTDHTQSGARRSAAARAANFRGVVVVPIPCSHGTRDALEFFSVRVEAPDQTMLDTLEAIGQELGQFMDRIEAQQVGAHLERERRYLLDRLQLQLNHMPVACLIQDRNFQVIYCNPAAERIFGYTASEMQGRDIVDFLVPESVRAAVWGRRAQVQAGEHNVTATNENTTRDGRTIICEWNITHLADEAGVFAGALVVAQDVTERTKMVAALEDSEVRYRQIFASAPLPMWVADTPIPRFLAVNDAMVEKYGYSRAELQQMTAIDLQLPEDRERVSTEILERDAKLQTHFERRHVTRDGRLILAEVTAQPFQFGGKTARLIVVNDVTDRRRAQQALEDSEAWFRAVFEQASTGIGIRDISSRPRWLRVNRKLCEILGYSEAELLQMTSVDVTPESDRTETGTYNLRLRTGDLRSYSRQKRYQRKDGRIIWVELSVAVVDGPDGQPHYLISVVHDITENVASRQLLKESEARYRQIFALTPLPMFLRGEETLRFVDMNDACLAAYGYTREEMLALSAADIQVPEEHQRFRDTAEGRPTGVIEPLQMKHVRKNGEIFDVEIFSYPAVLGDQKVQLVLVRDITEQLHSERLLRDSERRVALALGGSGGALFDWDVAAGTVYLSDRWNAMLGGEVRETYTTFDTLGNMVHPEDRPSQGAAIVRLLKGGGTPHQAEFRVKTHAGGWTWVESRASVTERDGQGRALRVLGTNIDITQRKQAELALRERDALLRESAAEIQTLNADLEKRVEQRTRALAVANRELESFSYSVSHDLRAPLRSIDGFSQILLQEYAGALDQTGRGYLERVRAGGQRMARLIDDLLELARVTRRELQIRTCDLTALVREIAQELQHAEPGRQARIVVADGMLVGADPGLLRIALDNLLRNAWKFTSVKPETVIEVGCTVADGESTYFVRDNGVGFDMAYVNKLFGAFQRLHSEAEFQGTGIGLALVQRVIRRHGGQVRAEGVPGGGATFYFTLPDYSPAAKGAVTESTATTWQPAPGVPRQ